MQLAEIVAAVREEIDARGWSRVARLSGVDRVTLHRNFSATMGHRKPRLELLLQVLPVVGLELELVERNGR